VLTPEQAIDAVNHAFGRHPGFRALHAKGTLCSGTFTATAEAATLTRAAHLQGGAVAVTARFSNGSGNPEEPDYASDVRGFAVGFHIPDGARTDIVAQTAPRFPVRTPEAFIELIRARTSGAAGAWRLPLFLARNPGALSPLLASASAVKPPASYASCRYHAIHAFRWIDAGGQAQYVRYRLEPQAGVALLSARAAKQLGADYLQSELAERLARGAARFTLTLQLGLPGDPVDDPSSAWPDTRRTVDAGTIELTAVAEPDPSLIFDPMHLTDGIEASDDPILRFRADAYGVSYARRTGAGA
jgi:catalase